MHTPSVRVQTNVCLNPKSGRAEVMYYQYIKSSAERFWTCFLWQIMKTSKNRKKGLYKI